MITDIAIEKIGNEQFFFQSSQNVKQYSIVFKKQPCPLSTDCGL